MAAIPARPLLEDPATAMRDAMLADGIPVSEPLVADGKLHRYHVDGDNRGNKNAWAVLFTDGVPAGQYGDWKRGVQSNWCGRSFSTLTATDRKHYEERQRKASLERQRAEAEAISSAQAEWNDAGEVKADHPYLVSREVRSYGLRQRGDVLLVPVYGPSRTLVSLQRIDPTGRKRFVAGCPTKNGSHTIGLTETPSRVFIAEGYATAATVHEATGATAVVAFSANNLIGVTRQVRECWPSTPIVIAGDNDASGSGELKGREAADAAGAGFVMPERVNDDWNDVARTDGLDAVKVALTSGGWAAPLPLREQEERKPYPVEKLPPLMRDAVDEVQSFVQCPTALAAASAHSVLSLATQHHYDVERESGLSGPCSIFVLSLAESGERKSQCDRQFARAIRRYVEEQRGPASQEDARHAAENAAWFAKEKGLTNAIAQAQKKSSDTSELEEALADLHAEKPERTRQPALLVGDATTEALTRHLAQRWPSAAILSDEGGIVLGGHSMRSETITRGLAVLNSLWDGSPIEVQRMTTPSFTLRGVRLSVGLMMQPDVFRRFFAESGGIARGIGFAARFLLCEPESTQGKRMFRAAPTDWPALAAWDQRIGELLACRPEIVDGAMKLPVVKLEGEARAIWILAHNTIESMLGKDGELASVRDCASKAADNIARLAALYHALEGADTIELRHVESAAAVVSWHLAEARRVLSHDGDEAASKAEQLSEWLVQYCGKHGVVAVSVRDVLQRAPRAFRRVHDLEPVITFLAESRHLRIEGHGRPRTLRMSPYLLPEGES